MITLVLNNYSDSKKSRKKYQNTDSGERAARRLLQKLVNEGKRFTAVMYGVGIDECLTERDFEEA
jgi:DNA-binding PadR family transcriptional regulator